MGFESQKSAKILQGVRLLLLKTQMQKSVQVLVMAENPLPKRRVVAENPLKMVEAGVVVENPLLLPPPLLVMGAVHLVPLVQLMEKSNTTHPSPPPTRRARAGQAGNHRKAGTRDADPREGRV